MPTYKEGHLLILGSGPAPPDTLPDAPPKHWFELHVLPAGLRGLGGRLGRVEQGPHDRLRNNPAGKSERERGERESARARASERSSERASERSSESERVSERERERERERFSRASVRLCASGCASERARPILCTLERTHTRTIN